MTYWLLVVSYWIHLIATVIWLGGMALVAFVAWPALRHGTLDNNQWLAFQRRFLPWANGSLVLLLITGFVQMTNDSNYSGFLVFDSLWAWAMLLKHIAFVGMVAIAIGMQAYLYPAMERVALLVDKRPQLAASEQARLNQREMRLLRLNLLCAALVLLFTAMATAV